jgi:hypothetical protein
MDKKQGNIIERHIEKAVLAAVGLVCAFILVKYVLLSPYVFKFDNKQFAAGQLDRYIEERADKIKERINAEPTVKHRYEPNEPRFVSKLDSSVNVEARINWPVPSSVELRQERKYRIPAVGAVKDVTADCIRAAAYVPKVEITTENQTDEKSYEPNDIDLVTVQGSFDIAALRESFQSCFSGKEVREEWRDTSLARPVFAAVQLQRQSEESNGQWSEWENVGRPKIEPYVAEFRVIEDVNELPSGNVMVRLLKMSDPKVQVSLLQPEPYQIASAEEEWFPPVLHKKYLTTQKEKELQERRDEMAKQRDEQKQEQDKMRQERKTARPPKAITSEPTGRGGGGGGGMGADDYMRMLGGGGAAPARSTPTRTVRERRAEPAVEDKSVKATKPGSDVTVYDEMNKILLKSKDFGKVTEPIVFWAYDDTVKPGHNYRYRVRLGVFNPVAGTGQVVAEDASYNDKAVLWSQFSDVTDVAAIPQRMYFFPVEVQEAAKQVDMQVCRYALGYWHSAQFKVKRGEVIGNHVDIEPNEKDKELTLPEEIDYTTGAVLVDVVVINDWTGDKNLQARHYFDVLYSFDGVKMERMASKQMYWPEELRIRYNEVKSMEKKLKLAFKTWGGSGAGGGQRALPGMAPGRGGRGGNVPMTADEYMQMLRGGQPQK